MLLVKPADFSKNDKVIEMMQSKYLSGNAGDGTAGQIVPKLNRSDGTASGSSR